MGWLMGTDAAFFKDMLRHGKVVLYVGLIELTEASILLNAKSGVNNLEISYADWNHGKKSYGSNDPRKLAIVIMQLSLQLQHN
jgi:hypothetical protein